LAGKALYTEREAVEAFDKAVKDTFTTDQLVHYVQSDFAATPVQSGAKPNVHTSLVIEPADGRIPAFTPEAQKRVAAQRAAEKARGPLPLTWRDDRGTQWCVFHDRAVPAIPAPYGSIFHIVQSKDFIVMTYEWNTERRVIPLDGHRTTLRQSERMPGMRAAAGRVTRWWSRPPTSHPNGTSLDPRGRSRSSSVSPAYRKTVSRTR